MYVNVGLGFVMPEAILIARQAQVSPLALARDPFRGSPWQGIIPRERATTPECRDVAWSAEPCVTALSRNPHFINILQDTDEGRQLKKEMKKAGFFSSTTGKIVRQVAIAALNFVPVVGTVASIAATMIDQAVHAKRDAQARGLTFKGGQFAAYVPDPQDALWTQIQLTPEPYVIGLYWVILGRSPDPTGLRLWSDGITTGRVDPEQAPAKFVASDEYQKKQASVRANPAVYVATMYRQLLGREPDQAGFDAWVNGLRSGRITLVQLHQGFLESPEFRMRLSQGGA